MPTPATSTRRARSIFPCVRVQRDYRDVDDIIRMCRRAHPRARAVVRRLPGGARRRADRRAAAEGAVEKYGRRDAARVHRRVVRLLRAAHGEAIRELPAAARRLGHATTRSPACRTGIPLKVAVEIDAEAGADRGRPARQRRLPRLRAQPLRALRDGQRDDRRLQLPIDPDMPAQRRQLPPRRRATCARARDRRVPTFPHSCSMATTNVADRLINAVAGGVRRARRRLRPGRGRGRDRRRLRRRLGQRPAGRRRAVREPDLARQQRRPRRARGRRLAHLRDARLRQGDLHRQHRGARAEVPAPVPRPAPAHRQRRARPPPRGSRERDGVRPDPCADAGLLLRRLRRSPTAGRGGRGRRRRGAAEQARGSTAARPRSTRSATSPWSPASSSAASRPGAAATATR